MPVFQIPSFRASRKELEEVRGRYLFRFAQPEVWHRCVPGGAQESIPGLHVQE